MNNRSKRPRKYTGVLQYFHNYEHDPDGRNHCRSNGQYPYTIKHENGKHVISNQIARGHGKGNRPQWFYFPDALEDGFDMSTGIKIKQPSGNSHQERIRPKMLRITPKRPRIPR